MFFLIMLLNMCMASTFILVKAALQYVSPLFFIGIRMILGGSLLGFYLYFFNREKLIIPKIHRTLFAQIIFFHIYGAYVLEFIGLKYVSAGKTCLIYCLVPFITALLSYLTTREYITYKKALALTVGFIGFLPILATTSMQEEGVGSIGFLSFPEALIIGSAACSAQGWIAVSRLVRTGYSPLMINGCGMIFGGILSLFSALIFENGPFIGYHPEMGNFPLNTYVHQWITSDYGMVLFYTIALIVLANIIGYNLYAHLLNSYSATFLSFANFMAPLFAALYGWILLGESVSPWFFISLSMVSLGLYLFYREERLERKNYKGPIEMRPL